MDLWIQRVKTKSSVDRMVWRDIERGEAPLNGIEF